MMKIGKHLLPAECDLLKALLFNREAALAWTMEEKGRISDNIEPPHCSYY
jgi:hypothetical protein